MRITVNKLYRFAAKPKYNIWACQATHSSGYLLEAVQSIGAPLVAGLKELKLHQVESQLNDLQDQVESQLNDLMMISIRQATVTRLSMLNRADVIIISDRRIISQ